MKSFVQKLDVAGLLLFILGFGFKVMHWPGAQLLWFLGCTLCTLPLIAKLKQSKSFLTKMFYLLLILFVLLTLCWGNLNVILLKKIHWGLLIALLVLKMIALLNAVNSANSTSRFVEKRLIILIFLSAITFCTSFGLVYFFYWANVIGAYIFFVSVLNTSEPSTSSASAALGIKSIGIVPLAEATVPADAILKNCRRLGCCGLVIVISLVFIF